MAYTPTSYSDLGPPALSAANLNHSEAGIKNASDRLDTVETSDATKATIAQARAQAIVFSLIFN